MRSRDKRKSDAGNPEAAAARLRRLCPGVPRLGLVLGSGFGGVAAAVREARAVPYAALSGFAGCSVGGHAGRAVCGILCGVPVVALCGRAHYYEGHDLETVTFPMRVLAALGVTDVLLTNAAGGIAAGLRPGDFMLVRDHINLMGVNPLRGPARPGLPRFVDMTRTYDAGLSGLLRRAARRCGLQLRAGVYLAVSGPSYETPAEVRAFRRLGADAVGMSTVPEAIVARQCGLRVAALSCITNRAAGLGARPPDHAEVLAVAGRVERDAVALIETFAGLYGEQM